MAAVSVDGGRAWPDNEPTRRATLAAQTASGRAAAHGHIQRPGPKVRQPAPGNTSSATSNTHTTTRARQRGGYRSTRPSLSHDLVEAQAESGSALAAATHPQEEATRGCGTQAGGAYQAIEAGAR